LGKMTQGTISGRDMDGIAALVAGPQSGPGEALMDISNDVGFSLVARYDGPGALTSQLTRTRLCFVLCAEAGNPRHYTRLIAELRGAGRLPTRFTPVIYFSEAALPDVITTAIELGFDDILTMPFSPDRVRTRLGQQIGRPLTYFETPKYFGPDRRRFHVDKSPIRRQGGTAKRFDISRSVKSGITVLREQLIEPGRGADSAA
jgi:CheY-like chemotaxis protein